MHCQTFHPVPPSPKKRKKRAAHRQTSTVDSLRGETSSIRAGGITAGLDRQTKNSEKHTKTLIVLPFVRKKVLKFVTPPPRPPPPLPAVSIVFISENAKLFQNNRTSIAKEHFFRSIEGGR